MALNVEDNVMPKLKWWETRRSDPEYILVIRQEVSPEDEALLRERLRIIRQRKGSVAQGYGSHHSP